MILSACLFRFSMVKDWTPTGLCAKAWLTGTKHFWSSGTKQCMNCQSVRNFGEQNDKVIDT